MSSATVEKRGSATTVKACDSCRKRKRRCLWTAGESSCNHCIQLKSACTTTHVRKQRTKIHKKDIIVDYERRIKSLEYLLQERSEAQPQFQQQPLQPADDSISLDTWVSNLRTQVDTFPAPAADVDPESYNDRLGEIEEEPLSAQTTNMTSTTNGIEDIHLQELEDFEPSTDFQLEAALLQDPSFQSDPITAKDCSSYLPPPELGVSLLTEFLVDFNTVYPIYRPYAIAEHLRICYEGRSDGSALAWASAYVVFGLAHRVRGMSLSTTPEDDQMADWYLYSILPTVSGLLAATPGFGLVQCLLGLALLIRSSRNHKPYALYISTALRIAQCFAYKSQENIDVRVDQDVEQERRVFWIAFILDTDQSMFSSVPTTPRRADINASLPDDDPQDKLGFITAAEGNLKVNFFCLRIELVLLESEAIEQILSTKAPKRTPPKTISAIQELLQRFQRWRDNDLFRRTPEELLQLLYRADLLHTLSVEASYFATVFRLHSFLLLKLDPNLNPFSTNILAKLAAQKTHASYKDAEHFLGLISMTPHRQIGICWVLQNTLVAALVTVLAHNVHSPPEEASSTSKMREYSEILLSLDTIVFESDDPELRRARDLVATLFAKIV